MCVWACVCPSKGTAFKELLGSVSQVTLDVIGCCSGEKQPLSPPASPALVPFLAFFSKIIVNIFFSFSAD